MALNAGSAKAMVQLLFIHCLLLLQLFAFLCKFLVLLYIILYVLAIFAPAVEKRVGSFTFIVLLMSCCCYRSLSLPHGALGWSAVSWPYLGSYLRQ